VKRASLSELAEWATGEVRGEITLVVGGATAQSEADVGDLAELVAVRELAGETRKEAIAAVAQQAGLPKRAVFDAVVASKSR
jgi:16S rRNA (cytidine1402-2'-O)-methyltransferase